MANFRPIVANILLYFLIFGMSATVNFSHFKEQITNGRAIATGVFCQFIILPLLGFAVVKVADFDFVWGITLLIITASPGGAYSNLFCSLFNADMALSVTMTAISTILSTAFLPLNVFIYSKLAYTNDPVLDTLDWVSLGITIIVVVAAVSSGVLLTYLYGSGVGGKRVRNYCNKFGNLCGLGLVLFTSLTPEGGRIIITDREPIFYYAPIMPMIFGLLLSNIISMVMRLKQPERVTVSIECVYQNTGIAMTSCLALFTGEDQSRGLAIAFWYTGMQGAIIIVYCVVVWKLGWTKAPANENFISMLVNNFQHSQESKEETSVSGDDAAAAAVDASDQNNLEEEEQAKDVESDDKGTKHTTDDILI